MKKLLSVLLVASLFMSAVPTISFAAARCTAEKRAEKAATKKDRDADNAVSKKEREIAKLERNIESYTRNVESVKARQDQAYTREVEKGQREIDRYETRRMELLVRVGELGLQIANCALADPLNGLFGTDLSCPASTRNALLVESENASAEIARIALRVEEVRSRASRKANSKYKEYNPKVKQAQQKLDRAVASLNTANGALPGLQQRAIATQIALDQAEAALSQCLSL